MNARHGMSGTASNRRAPTGVRFRAAVGSDAPALTEIAFAAKRHWGYPEEWMALWADELTIEPGYVANNWVLVATRDAGMLGWCAVEDRRGELWVEYCWVLSAAAGQGIGRAMMQRAFAYAADRGVSSMKVIADPNAEGFYRKLGFRRIGDVPSRPEGRRLPLLEIDLAARGRHGTAAT